MVHGLYLKNMIVHHERPHDRENTASRLICEVKHVPVWIVVRWGTTREVQMLFFFLLFYPLSIFFLSFFLFLIFFKFLIFSLFLPVLLITKYQNKNS